MYSRRRALLAAGAGLPCFFVAFANTRSWDEILFLVVVVLPAVSGAMIGWCPRGFLELLGLALVYAATHLLALSVHVALLNRGEPWGLTLSSTLVMVTCAFLTLAARMGLGYPREYTAD